MCGRTSPSYQICGDCKFMAEIEYIFEKVHYGTSSIPKIPREIQNKDEFDNFEFPIICKKNNYILNAFDKSCKHFKKCKIRIERE